mgnify:CR=1 FL=1
MKVEDPSALLVQWFYHKSTYLPKGDESSWQNCIKYAARSATTKRTFIATEKINTDTRNTSARGVGISLHQRRRQGLKAIRVGQGESHSIHPLALFAAGSPSYTMTVSITLTIPAATRNAAIRCSCPSLLPSRRRPCPSSLERRISNGCVTRSM